jgi:hypothetical protein
MMRANLQQLRRCYAPRSIEESKLLDQYRDVIQEFGRELLKARVRIDVDRLNDLSDQVFREFVFYLQVRSEID